MRPTRIYIVRHGETEENLLGIMQGQLDTRLNATGLEQADAVAEALREVPFDAAFSSDLIRASLTAQMILKYHPNVALKTDERLRERFMGEMQGRPIAHAMVPSSEVPSMETSSAFIARALAWWKATIPQSASREDLDGNGLEPIRVLVVSHGGFITNALLRGLIGGRHLKCAPGVQVGKCLNTAICEIETHGRKGTVLRFGDVSHLSRRAVEDNADEIEVVEYPGHGGSAVVFAAGDMTA